MRVYVLSVGSYDTVVMGVYSSRANVDAAKSRLRSVGEHEDDIIIEEFELDGGAREPGAAAVEEKK